VYDEAKVIKMAEYLHSKHIIHDIKYHVVWITKYRYKILTGEIAKRARELLILIRRAVCGKIASTVLCGATRVLRLSCRLRDHKEQIPIFFKKIIEKWVF
jgi:hypothetical protein